MIQLRVNFNELVLRIIRKNISKKCLKLKKILKESFHGSRGTFIKSSWLK